VEWRPFEERTGVAIDMMLRGLLKE
jgi:hypothetical protein